VPYSRLYYGCLVNDVAVHCAELSPAQFHVKKKNYVVRELSKI
jgi:hypothetical protein